jgi:CheY-like chemotaxis protein
LILKTANAELDATAAANHPYVVPGNYVLVAVSDTGVGMDPEVCDRMFEPFFTTKDPGRGSGLGLSTVYGIVKQSGGYIWADSEPNGGTTFKVYLPGLLEPSDPVKREPSTVQVDTGTETILLVEDEESVRDLICRILRTRGYTVLSGSRAAEAMELCREASTPVDLLISDIVIPGGVSGIELAARLQDIYPQLRVLYISGYTDDAVLGHEVVDSGMHFLQKPFAPAVLTGKVRQVLDD